MSVRITDILKDPLDNPCPKTIIRVTTIVGEGSTLKYAVEEHVTDSNGLYDFNLVYGVHDIEILWTDTYEYIGTATINDGTPNPTTLQGAIDYVTPIPIPPPLSDNPSWTDLYQDTINSLDSEGSHTNSQWASGPATILEDRKVFCNTVMGSAYSQLTNMVCTSPTESNVNQAQSYSDATGAVSGYRMDSTQIDGQCAYEEISLTRDGVGNVCSYKRDVFDASRYTESVCIAVNPTDTARIEEYLSGNFQLRKTSYFDANGACTALCTSSPCFLTTQESLAVDTYTANSQPVNKACVSDKLSQCVGTTILTEDTRVAQELPDGSFCSLSSYTSCVGTEHVGLYIMNDGVCSEIRHTATKHTMGYLQGDCFFPSMEIDTSTGCIIFCGNVEFNSCNCENFQGPPGNSQRIDVEYAPYDTGPWDSTLDPGDKWQRSRTVTILGIDGSETYGPWIGPFNLYAEDGSPGDTLYFEYQYSIDGITGWHSTLTEGDKFRRERMVTNGNAGPWSSPVRIVGDDGIDGTGVAVLYDYTVDPTVEPVVWVPNYSEGMFWRRERYYSVYPDTGLAPEPFHVLILKIIPEIGVDYVNGSSGAGYYAFDGIMPVGDTDITACFYKEAGRFPVSGDTFVAYNDATCTTNAKQFYCGQTPEWDNPTMKIDGGLVVTGTIGAAQIAANSISGENIQANSTIVIGCTLAGGTNIVGIDGNLTSCWRLYAGCTNAAVAPFRVDCAGALYASNAHITGDICATSGTFSGTICGSTILGNTFCGSTICGGTICGSTGIFCGTLCVNNLKGNIISIDGLTTTSKTLCVTLVADSPEVAGTGSTTAEIYNVTVSESSPYARYLEIRKPHPDFECFVAQGQSCCYCSCKITEYCILGSTWSRFEGESVAVPIPINCSLYSARVRYTLCATGFWSGAPIQASFPAATATLMVAPQGSGLTSCPL